MIAQHSPFSINGTRRISWCEVKVKVGKMHAGKAATWSMTLLFTPHRVTTEGTATTAEVTVPVGQPRFRGSWEHAADEAPHDACSFSEAYGRHDWQRAIATAIRVNLPLIGFNKACVSIDVRGTESPLGIDIEPGHGYWGARAESAGGAEGRYPKEMRK